MNGSADDDGGFGGPVDDDSISGPVHDDGGLGGATDDDASFSGLGASLSGLGASFCGLGASFSGSADSLNGPADDDGSFDGLVDDDGGFGSAVGEDKFSGLADDDGFPSIASFIVDTIPGDADACCCAHDAFAGTADVDGSSIDGSKPRMPVCSGISNSVSDQVDELVPL